MIFLSWWLPVRLTNILPRGWGKLEEPDQMITYPNLCWLGCRHLLRSKMKNTKTQRYKKLKNANADHLHVGALILAWVKTHLCTHFKHYFSLEMEKSAEYEFSDQHNIISYQISDHLIVHLQRPQLGFKLSSVHYHFWKFAQVKRQKFAKDILLGKSMIPNVDMWWLPLLSLSFFGFSFLIRS